MTVDIEESLKIVLEDWKIMQQTRGDEGAEAAERFENHFYDFIETLKGWFHTLEAPPTTIEQAEKHPVIETIIERLPGPLQLNFLTELEYITEGEDRVSYD